MIRCVRHSDTGAFEGGDSEHKSPRALAIAWPCEVKQDWVQKTVHAGKWPGALIDDREQVSGCAACTWNAANHHVRSLGEVKGQKTNTEHHSHHDDHLYRLVPFLPSRHGDASVGRGPAKDLSHPGVAQHDSQKRQRETEAGQGHAVGIVIC